MRWSDREPDGKEHPMATEHPTAKEQWVMSEPDASGHGGLLVVDDEPFLRDAVATSLRFLGYDVTTAENGAEALRLAREHPFDLVVLDVMLPDIDGFQVIGRLR